MKKIYKRLSLILVFSLVFTLAPLNIGEAKGASEDIVIIYTGDMGGNISHNLGLASVVAYANEKRKESYNVALVNVGNTFTGYPLAELSKGAYVVKGMNAAKYALSTVGKYDLDLGSAYLRDEVAGLSDFELLGLEENNLYSYKIMSYGGSLLGYIGITESSEVDKQTVFSKMQSTVKLLKDVGIKYVVVLGSLEGKNSVTPKEILENTEGINLFINSNSGKVDKGTQVKTKSGAVALLTSPGSGLESFGVATIKPGDRISAQIISSYNLRDIGMQTTLEKLEQEYKPLLKADFGEAKVSLEATNGKGIRKIEGEETNLGDLVADSYKRAMNADIALVESTDIRRDIPRGKISYDQIVDVLPKGNGIRAVKVTGEDILDALEMSVMKYPDRSRKLLQVSGLTFDVMEDTPSSVELDSKGAFKEVNGAYRVTNVKVNGKELSLLAEYKVAASENFLRGDSGYVMFADKTRKCTRYISDNMALINYISKDLENVVGSDYEKSQLRMDSIKLVRKSELEKMIDALVDERLEKYKKEYGSIEKQMADSRASLKMQEMAVKIKNMKLRFKEDVPRISFDWVTSSDLTDVKYQVWRSTKKNSGFKKLFTTDKKTFLNKSNLVKGQKYYYKVRAFKTIDGKAVYSEWSHKEYVEVGRK